MGGITFNWVEATPVYQKTAISATEYVLVDGDADTDGVQINYRNLTAAASGATTVTYVYVAAKAGDGDGKQITVHRTFGDDAAAKIPATHFATEGSGSDHGTLYAMDDNDTYIKNGESSPPCVVFRPQAGDVVRVVIYFTDSGKASIYEITPAPQLGVVVL